MTIMTIMTIMTVKSIIKFYAMLKYNVLNQVNGSFCRKIEGWESHSKMAAWCNKATNISCVAQIHSTHCKAIVSIISYEERIPIWNSFFLIV